MASFRKLSSGNYQATIYVGRDADGKVLRKYVTRPTLKECKAAAREIEQEISSKDLSNVAMMKMSDYMEKWLEMNEPMLTPSTIQSYRMYVDVHFTPAFGHLRVEEITDMHIKAYMADKLADLSPTTCENISLYCRKCFKRPSKMHLPALG